MTATVSPSTPGGPSAARPGRRWVTVLLAVLCLGIAALWTYALFFASKDSVSRVDDRSWAERATGICTAANEARAELADERRIDDVGDGALAERADIIDRATIIVEQMVDDLVAVQPAGVEDKAILATWEGFYRDLIQDRRDYTVTLREGRNEPFSETAQEGAPITEWINDFTVANEITECSAPLDLSI